MEMPSVKRAFFLPSVQWEFQYFSSEDLAFLKFEEWVIKSIIILEIIN